MLRRLFSGPQGKAGQPAPPPDTCLYAIGDIHGRTDLLRALHALIAEDAARRSATRKLIVYLGDFVDRGRDSRGVIEMLLASPLAGFECVHLRGNHEDTLLRFLEDISAGPGWFSFGGEETVASYGVRRPLPSDDEEELRRVQREFRSALPAAHLRFLERLKLCHMEGDYFCVHAGVKPGVPLDQQDGHDLMWIREEFLNSKEDFGKVVVHGHTITREPELRRNRIGIDTGAFATNRLTCLAAEGVERTIIQT
jgi:serine/threonine protein phosphatase 1